METLDSLRSGLASGRLSGCKTLKLADGLTEFPSEILALAESLTFLNLSNNSLRALPPEFAQLTKLEIAFFNNNKFEIFPEVLAQCPKLSMVSFKANQLSTISDKALSPNLRWLILTNNQLSTLPPSIGKLHRLQKLMLAGNRLTDLPKALANCTNLELIRLAANQLKQLPDWLYRLPRLSWLAYAGNPFCEAISRERVEKREVRSLPIISAKNLTRDKILGEGASGIIYRGNWTAPDQLAVAKTVALKLFKGEITSDGSPLDEMQACIAAGTHPNLVKVLGKLASPNETGLVFDFVSSDYENLGEPPSLESCTRDIYKPEQSFTLQEILKIVSGMASVLAHLHQNGIVHGDFYAHNILLNTEAHSILGDFGAASFYIKEPKISSHPLEKIEVRAFGCLLEELLLRCTDRNQIVVQQLSNLQRQCVSPALAERPTFEHIVQTLSQIS
ncbi:MAG: leucine-rich repeat-containing protein kinase family protein [Cyanobacteria bacterium J06581_3]